ncbi:MAG: chitobiase/beta-hexosaminidase C-terminal domain-containing protein [Muribaculaceae bacterium]|nr:chitobiase/beta-hexosaminidase C-terminal domain-containing protein [Muribaculaceae bacterium]
MKKFLLSLFAMVAFAGMAVANTATVTFSTLGYDNAADVAVVKVNDDITLTFDKGAGSNGPKYYNSGNAVRLYGGNTLTVKGADGVTLTSVEFSCGSGNPMTDAFTAAPGSLAIDGAKATWTGNANEFVITNTNKSGHAKIETITFTYTGGTGGGGGGTVDPDPDPDPEVQTVDNLAAFLQCAKGDTRIIKSDAVVVRQLGANLWIKDNSGWMLVYGNINGSTAPTFENGDVIKGGYKGTLDIYNNLPEMKDVTNFEKSGTTTPVQPALVNTGDADAEPLNSYIKMTGCTITGKGRSYKANDGSGEVALYTSSASFTVPEGENMTVYAFVSVFGENKQLTPVEVTTASGREVVATPYFTPAAGAVNKGDQVTIKCSTEGATIYYTLDGTNPNAESNVYSEAITITEDVTIKALAVKEGMDDSDIATANYTIIVLSDNDVTFNFADISTLTPLYTDADYEDDGQTGNFLINVENVAFTAKGVSVKAVYTDPTAEGTQARLYKQSSGTCSYRVYNKSSIVITAPENNPITKITYEFYNGKTSYSKLTAPAEGTWEAPVWTAPAAGASEAIFVCTGTQQIKTITVSLKDIPSGVEAVTVENENAPVEYYNLQGVRVQNPENGLFIRRQGNSVSKIIIR